MNALDEEYEDSARRAALTKQRRDGSVGYAVALGVWAAYRTASAFSNGKPASVVEAVATTLVIAMGLSTIVRLIASIGARVRDRAVVNVTTEREKTAYRSAWLPAVAFRETSRSRRHAVAALAVTYVVLVDVLARVGDFIVIDAAVAAAIAVGWAVMHLYRAWRQRRAARRDLESERWLASADACEVRAREWTK